MDISKFQRVQLCKYTPYKQVDFNKAHICEDCRLQKLTIIGHHHTKFLPVSILGADDSFLEYLRVQYMTGRAESAELEKAIADQASGMSNKQGKTFDLSQRRCAICTNLATSICNGCPLKLCDTCEAVISTSDCKWKSDPECHIPQCLVLTSIH